MNHDPLIVALDVPTFSEAKEWVERLSSEVKQFKVGSQLFTSQGPKVIEMIHQNQGKVFLDLKWHDIPNTVANACREAVRMDVWMMNVHSLGGLEMMKAAKEAVVEESLKEKKEPPILIAVTVLTSMDQHSLQGVGIERPVEEQVGILTSLVKEAGLEGVVASGFEVSKIKEKQGAKFLTIVPGIKNPFEKVIQSDQKRVLTPEAAINEGADFLVMGRGILKSENPIDIIQQIRQQWK